MLKQAENGMSDLKNQGMSDLKMRRKKQKQMF